MHKIMGHEIGVMVKQDRDWSQSKKQYTAECSCSWHGKTYDTLNMADKEALWHALEVIGQKTEALYENNRLEQITSSHRYNQGTL